MAINWKYSADFVTVPIMIGAALAFGAHEPRALVGSSTAGWLSWIATEYFIHRWVFHSPKLGRRQHWVHHLRPLDKGEHAIVLPWYSNGLLLAVGALAQGLAQGWGVDWWAGLVFGYWTYITFHHAIHHGWLGEAGLFGGVVRRHNLHHRGVEANFNVLVPLGDLLAGTFIPSRSQKPPADKQA